MLKNERIEVTFCGATQTVTGSMHLVQVGDRKILLDCGLVMGRRSEARQLNRHFPFSPKEVDAVIITHAHLDHCGNLPNLVRQGFDGPILCTPATKDLLDVILTDQARYDEESAAWKARAGLSDDSELPRTTLVETGQTLDQCIPLTYGNAYVVGDAVEVKFANAGHVLGSAMASLRVSTRSGDRTLAYTGDLGRPGLGFLRDPERVPEADLLICESTYGGRFHQPMGGLMETVEAVVKRTVERGGKVLIPAFSFGRTQLVVHYLDRWRQDGRIPNIPIFVDSPLAAKITRVHQQHRQDLVDDVRLSADSGDSRTFGVRYASTQAESVALGTNSSPSIIVASGGMCDNGRILHHLQHNIDDPRCTVVLVSYQAPFSLGRRLLEPGPTVRFRGKHWNKWAEIVEVSGFSGHADHGELLTSLEHLAGRTKQVRLVHGERESAVALAAALEDRGFTEIDIPARAEKVCVA